MTDMMCGVENVERLSRDGLDGLDDQLIDELVSSAKAEWPAS